MSNIAVKSGSASNLAEVNRRLGELSAAVDTDAATFMATVAGQNNTSATYSIALEAGASKVIRLRRILFLNLGIKITTPGIRLFQLIRTTTPSTGGVMSIRPSDLGDTFTGIARAKPSPLGTAGAVLVNFPYFVGLSVDPLPKIWDLEAMGFGKGILVPAGANNGIALADPGGAGASSFSATFVFTEEST